MKIRKIDQAAQRAEIARTGRGDVNKGPILRIIADGQGCGLDGCNCSDKNFVTISDGTTLLTARLSDRQARDLRVLNRLEIGR